MGNVGVAGIPEAVERLIAQHIDSVEQLEILLLLSRTSPRGWTANDVASDLRVDSGSAQRRLEDLTRRGFADQNGESFQYRANNSMDASVRQLADSYRERRVAIITMIFTKPVDPVRELAEAFRISRKGPKDG